MIYIYTPIYRLMKSNKKVGKIKDNKYIYSICEYLINVYDIYPIEQHDRNKNYYLITYIYIYVFFLSVHCLNVCIYRSALFLHHSSLQRESVKRGNFKKKNKISKYINNIIKRLIKRYGLIIIYIERERGRYLRWIYDEVGGSDKTSHDFNLSTQGLNVI